MAKAGGTDIVWMNRLMAAAIVMSMSVAWAQSFRADAGEDDRVKQRVQTRLAGQIALHIESLGIEVEDGNLHLTGIVGSLGEKTRAERVVGGIVGVKAITNDLSIRPSDRSETAIAQEVQRQLETRTRFRRTPIQVTVSGTEVTLGGVVERALDRLDAEEIAAEAQGVTRVINTLQIRSEGTHSAESIRSRVLSILTNPLTFGAIRHPEVSVEAGVVTLQGVVSRDGERVEAERLTLGVPGVTGVINLLKVGGGS